MLDAVAVHQAIDSYTASMFPDVPVLYTNQINDSLSNGTVPFIKQSVFFLQDTQLELGNSSTSRQRGTVVIIIYTRKGTGSMSRDTLYQRVRLAFRNKLIGGATFQEVQSLRNSLSEQWQMSAYQIPFFFNSI